MSLPHAITKVGCHPPVPHAHVCTFHSRLSSSTQSISLRLLQKLEPSHKVVIILTTPFTIPMTFRPFVETMPKHTSAYGIVIDADGILCTSRPTGHYIPTLTTQIDRFEVFTAVTMKNGVFRDVTPCGSCKNRCFRGT
jgi:hypothetical protein